MARPTWMGLRASTLALITLYRSSAVYEVCFLTAAVYDAGVMDVHRGVAGVMNKAVEEAQFELKIVFPYAADGDLRRQRWHGSAAVI
jgi:hypothetical protein